MNQTEITLNEKKGSEIFTSLKRLVSLTKKMRDTMIAYEQLQSMDDNSEKKK